MRDSENFSGRIIICYDITRIDIDIRVFANIFFAANISVELFKYFQSV